MSVILITGASGLIGKRLTTLLLQNNYNVNVIGRNKRHDAPAGVKEFLWNVERGEMDEKAFEGVEAIIHLAGAGVADKRWTDSRKQEIIDSRVKSATLLHNFLKKGQHKVKTFISAAAVGYYGDCGDELVLESRKAGQGFLADVCKKWEGSAEKIGNLGVREVRCRIGVVLAAHGGALPPLTRTIPFGLAPYFAKRDLFYPWIHLDDVCGIMLHALQNKAMQGAYNTTAPKPLLIKDLMREILKAKKKKALLMPVPPLAVELLLGEMSDMVLYSQMCLDEKLQDTGYVFKFADINKALKDIYKEA